jgi:hemerythrin HHE cation binding domain-containing protein
MSEKEPGAVTREMAMVHTGFLREYFAMPDLVRGVAEGDRERAGIVADHITLIGVILHIHHSGEDLAIWPRLLERCPEEIAPLVHGMEKHHEHIAACVDDLTEQIPAWRDDPGAATSEPLLRTLGKLLPVLRTHLVEELDYVLPLIEKNITGDEWDEMVQHGVPLTPPESIAIIFGSMMYEGDPRAVQDALDNMPAEARAMIAEAAPKAYGDYAELLYGTRTPPRTGAELVHF